MGIFIEKVMSEEFELDGALMEMLVENRRRHRRLEAGFDPISGEGSIGRRVEFRLRGLIPERQWIPAEMAGTEMVREMGRHSSLDGFIVNGLGKRATERSRGVVRRAWVRLRFRYDFAFWAASTVFIKRKGGGDDVLFRLTPPQRKFVGMMEEMRLEGKPIRVILLKARQWGGSTTSQLYMAWLQLCHERGLNSLIVAQQVAVSEGIKDMFDRMMARYPAEFLHEPGEACRMNEVKMRAVGRSGLNYRIVARNCKITIGSAERPDSCRGGDYNLVHLSEVGIWKRTEGKSPEDIVRSACSGILLRPMTMIVYESTANGTGNFFHREWMAAKDGDSQFRPLFVSWWDIPEYSAPIEDPEGFCRELMRNRRSEESGSSRRESGAYLWRLWEMGATLEGINWYVQERMKYSDHSLMAAEYPSDDVEAFAHAGARVFDPYRVEDLRRMCKDPVLRGEVQGRGREGREALADLRFIPDVYGDLFVWELPERVEPGDETFVANRYLVAVDVGGRGSKADWSVITVFDRVMMVDGGKPAVVAQWRGHCDMDILAWRAAQIAMWYERALLVIESNTLETHDRERQVDGDQSLYILSQIRDVYDNLYARRQSEDEVREGAARRYGFHTNAATKPLVISGLIRAVRERGYVERDGRCLDEYLSYERRQNGSYGAVAGCHDDMLMTRAIGLHVCFNEMELPREVPVRRTRGGSRGRMVSEAML